MRHEHKKLGAWVEMPEPFLQGDIEALFKATREAGVSPTRLTGPEYNGAIVRAAAGLGWCGAEAPVEKMRPAAVTWIASKINGVVADALEVPPE